MDDAEKQKIISELKDFYKKLRSYQNRQLRRAKGQFSEAQDRSLNALRLELQREYGRLANVISEYGGVAYIPMPLIGEKYEVFGHSLSTLDMPFRGFDALDGAIGLVNSAIGKLESASLTELELPKATSVAQEPADTAELPIYLFDKMQFHQRIIAASKSLFESGHYSQAIFEAFKAVNNFVKEKSGLSLDGKALMSKVFNEDAPIIKLNELLTQSDKDEQEGFKFLFMGAMVGIRNPKAHDNVIQTDPYRTLEYLGFASLLMKRIEEGKVVSVRKHV